MKLNSNSKIGHYPKDNQYNENYGSSLFAILSYLPTEVPLFMKKYTYFRILATKQYQTILTEIFLGLVSDVYLPHLPPNSITCLCMILAQRAAGNEKLPQLLSEKALISTLLYFLCCLGLTFIFANPSSTPSIVILVGKSSFGLRSRAPNETQNKQFTNWGGGANLSLLILNLAVTIPSGSNKWHKSPKFWVIFELRTSSQKWFEPRLGTGAGQDKKQAVHCPIWRPCLRSILYQCNSITSTYNCSLSNQQYQSV